MLSFLFLIIVLSQAALLPKFSPFDLGISSTGYSIEGKYCQNFDGSCVDSTLVINPSNQSLAIIIDPFGHWITLYNRVVIHSQAFAPQCFQVTGRNWTTEEAGYTLAKSDRRARYPGHAEYTGFIDVADACGHPEVVSIKMEDDVIVYAHWSLWISVPIGPGGSYVCYNYHSWMHNDLDTLDRFPDWADYFTLPPDCSIPLDYCPSVYPPGNACYP